MKLALLMAGAASLLYAQQQPTQDQAEVRFGTTVVIPTGLQGQIYNLRKYSKGLPDFEKKKPVGTVYTTSLNVPAQDFRLGFPGVTKRTEWFAIDYRGKFWIQMQGVYKFTLTSDDGSKLYIDDLLVIDNDGVHGTIAKEGSVTLAEGVHRIRVSYFQGPGYAVALVLEVQAPMMPPRIFSTNDYKPPSTLETLPATIPH
jgi:hypothetical protein